VAKYNSILASRSTPSTAPAPEFNLLTAMKERYKQPSPLVLKILSTLAIPQQAMIGAVENVVDRERHPFASPIGFGQAMLQGVANPETSFGDIEGVGKKTGMALDIVADPMWVLGGPLEKGMSLGVRQVARGADLALKKSPALEHIVGRAMTKVKPNWARERAGYKGFDTVATEARMAENEVGRALLDDTTDKVHTLVPDEAKRQRIGELYELKAPAHFQDAIKTLEDQAWELNTEEKRALRKMKRAVEKQPAVEKEIAALSTPEREAFDLLSQRLPLIEKFRVEMGGLNKAIPRAFEERTGLSYNPRLRAGRDAIVSDLEASLAKYGSTWEPEKVASLKQDLALLKSMETQPSESYIREMTRRYTQGRTITPGFTKFREIGRSVRALRDSPKLQDQLLYALIEKDIAKNLHQASVQTARAVYRHMYIESFKKWMMKNNLLVKADDVGKLPPGIYGKGPREMVPIENVPELKGYFGPRVLVEDLHDMVMSPLDPEKVKNSISALRKMNGWFRGWALSAPMTVVRNAADSLVWRNIAAGANPVKDMPHWFQAGNILQDARRGTLDATEKLVGGKTAAEWFKEFVRAGTVRSNVYEETRMMSRGAGKRLLYAHTNPYGKLLMDNFEKVEDVARSGMYMWKRSQGMSPAEAMRFTNKWHIDYRHGLTPWERNVRDRFIPFYTFTRFNLPLALETLVHHPRLATAAGHGMDTWEDMAGIPDEDFPLAGWMASGTPLKIRYDDKTGTYSIFMLDGWWSFTDLNKLDPGRLIDTAATMVTPFLSAPYSVIKNHKLFPDPSAGQKLERPGDKFEMFGKKAEFPFDKRVESIVRIFRPLNEADRWLEAFDTKYGDTIGSRARNVIQRMLLGKVYPTTREEQVRYIKAATDEQLRALYSARNRLERNEEPTDDVEEMIDGVKETRKSLGIK
jgi:hypothetical protein